MAIKSKPSDFIRSFLEFISKRDSDILHDALYNMNFNREKIIEILLQYGIRLVPTRTIAEDLVAKAAVSELLSKPLTVSNAMKESFRNYFDGYQGRASKQFMNCIMQVRARSWTTSTSRNPATKWKRVPLNI